jgi:Xaa-Pro dipeptidase
MPVHFTPQEMSARRARAASALQARGLDGLLMFKQESMYYLTGYDTFGFSMFQCLHMDADGSTTLLTRLPDLRQAQYTSDIKDIRLWHDVEGVNPGDELKSMLADLGCGGQKLGIEFNSYGLTAHTWRYTEAALAGFVKLEDASRLVDELRAVKSAKEIEYARRAAVLSDDGWDEAVRLGHSGAFEGDILAAMQGAVFKGGGDYAGNEFIIGSGPAALLVRYQAHRRHLDTQDQLTLEWSGAYRRYHAAMMRTLLIGRAQPEHHAMHAACHDALLACMGAVKPGQPMADVYDAHASVMDAAGFYEHRMRACGYGMSAIYNPLWVDPPMFYEGNPRIMQPNNIFFLHMILADSDSGCAMTLGQSVLVTDTGCENLSRSGLELVVNVN